MSWKFARKVIGRMLLRPSLVPLLLALPCGLNAQVVRGRVLEAEGERPIRLATLELLDDQDHVVMETLSGSTGAFRLRARQAGEYRLRASGLGYEPVTSELMEVANGGEFVLEVRLAADAIPLEPITVVSRSQSAVKEVALRGFYNRRASFGRIGLGRFYERSQIEEMGIQLTDVLRRVPGLGRCSANIYLDGLLIRRAGESDEDIPLDIDQFVPLEWVEAIEVYRHPWEIPAEFAGILGSAACGVVAIWTRWG